jgi:hypothetical protein
VEANGHGERLSRLTEAAVAALLTHPTIREAAAAANIDERTLRNWLKDPDFVAAYSEARRELLEHAIGLLQGSIGAAVAKLKKLMKSGNPAIELKAAMAIIQLATDSAAPPAEPDEKPARKVVDSPSRN